MVNMSCRIEEVGKRRDGNMRFWCRTHKANATGKHGVKLDKCELADLQPPSDDEILTLDIKHYSGGIGIWGAVPAVYSTAQHNYSDIGIHIHARHNLNGEKEIDQTFRVVKVQLPNGLFESSLVEIDEEAAVYFMVSQVFGYEMSAINCPKCGEPHLDKDFFSVNPHRRHLCAGCGRHFNASGIGVGNPLISIRDYFGLSNQLHKTVKPNRSLEIKQADYKFGIELWGSNPAILWTAHKTEEEGIHVHCYNKDKYKPDIDETFDSLIVDGYRIDPNQFRVLMAQLSLPHLRERVRSLSCPTCGSEHFDCGKKAHTPHLLHTCESCGVEFKTPGRTRNVVSNPMLKTLAKIENFTTLERRPFAVNLQPETI